MDIQEKVAKAMRENYLQQHRGRTPGNYTPWALLPAHRRTKWLDMAAVAVGLCRSELNHNPLLQEGPPF